jgi:hypothetical protein
VDKDSVPVPESVNEEFVRDAENPLIAGTVVVRSTQLRPPQEKPNVSANAIVVFRELAVPAGNWNEFWLARSVKNGVFRVVE